MMTSEKGRGRAVPMFALTLFGVALGRRSRRAHDEHEAPVGFLTYEPDDEFAELGSRPPAEGERHPLEPLPVDAPA